MRVDLGSYNNHNYDSGANILIRATWYFINIVVFHTKLFPFSGIKTTILRTFGCNIGKSVVIKPGINIKYPWKLSIGNNVWLGEDVWIDNLAQVSIGSDVCISQGAYILTGNHDYNDSAFALMLGSVQIDDGVWVGAKSIVCPGTHLRSNSVLTVGSILQKDTAINGIYLGNPANIVRYRKIRDY